MNHRDKEPKVTVVESALRELSRREEVCWAIPGSEDYVPREEEQSKRRLAFFEETLEKVYYAGHDDGEMQGHEYVLRRLHDDSADIASSNNFVRDSGVQDEVTAAIERYAESEADGLGVRIFDEE